MITEGTFISEEAGGFPSVPGVWSEEQIEAWKPVTKAVHSKGGFIFVQVCHFSRSLVANVDFQFSCGPLAVPTQAPKTFVCIRHASPMRSYFLMSTSSSGGQFWQLDYRRWTTQSPRATHCGRNPRQVFTVLFYSKAELFGQATLRVTKKLRSTL